MKVGANPTHDAYVASWKDRVPADRHVNSLCGFRSVLHLFLNRNPQVKSAQKTLEIRGKSAAQQILFEDDPAQEGWGIVLSSPSALVHKAEWVLHNLEEASAPSGYVSRTTSFQRLDILLGFFDGGVQIPEGIKAHSTRAMATSWAERSELSIEDIWQISTPAPEHRCRGAFVDGAGTCHPHEARRRATSQEDGKRLTKTSDTHRTGPPSAFITGCPALLSIQWLLVVEEHVASPVHQSCSMTKSNMEDLSSQEGRFDDEKQMDADELQTLSKGKMQDASKLDEDETITHGDAAKTEASTVLMQDDAAVSETTAKMCDDSEQTSNAGMYRYIKDDLFTSEIFKVEIQNLPKYIGFNDLKKFLAKYGLNPHKIKLMQRQTFAFVTFKSEEERNKAMKVIHGVMWKNRLLTVRLAKPKADPIMKKRKQDDDEKEQSHSKRKAAEENAPEEALSKQIADVVTPLWQIPYEEQLKMKGQECEHVLQRLTKEIGNNNKALLPWLFVQKQKYNKVCCPLEGVRPSPVQTEYRNKCEFLIGAGASNEDKTVGFRLGKYKGGTCAVVEPFDTVHIPCITKKVAKAFQEYIRASPYVVYSPESYGGHWKQLTVRSTRKGHVMAIVYFHPQKLGKEDLTELKSSLAKFFTDGPGKDSGVTSLYFVEEGQRKSPNLEDLPVEHVTGEHYIFEELLGLTFRISPHAFFQVNTLAAEVLYSAIADWAQLDHNSTVLDVCCGTGTIGISLAKKVKKVVGIELCQEAISDAKANAEINGMCPFKCFIIN
ncbi:unnamed protein product [Ranitomeya imitator]|uniref:tRNA (uracil(54)-C(5))-methyltransferase n=1 Tax=Ranitomeya imitator TaxID=111125 RepID=A0ABN9MAH6_9NEOB|nr:unnamed protein product [Ranitomeya imitator]